MVGHGYPPPTAVGKVEVLIVEGLAEDAASSSPVALRDVSHLDDEVRYDAVDHGALIGQQAFRSVIALGKGREVPHCHGDCLSEQSHDEDAFVVLSRSIKVTYTDLKPDLFGNGVYPAVTHRQHTTQHDQTQHSRSSTVPS